MRTVVVLDTIDLFEHLFEFSIQLLFMPTHINNPKIVLISGIDGRRNLMSTWSRAKFSAIQKTSRATDQATKQSRSTRRSRRGRILMMMMMMVVIIDARHAVAIPLFVHVEFGRLIAAASSSR